MTTVTMTVNGRERSGEAEGRTLLTEFLRDELKLTGTHIGCDTSQCGACVVHVNGRSVKACTTFASACDGAEGQHLPLHGLPQHRQGNPICRRNDGRGAASRRVR